MVDELKHIEIDPTQYTVDRYLPHVSEDDTWLFNSGRDYISQIGFYKAHKGIKTE